MPDQPPGQTANSSIVAFGAWTLNTRTGVLARLGGPAATLRPKTAAVLARLLAAPGTLVSRETLLDDVWPGVTVTEDSVTQCIAEIRRSLGEDGKLLRTAPRRGYVMDVPAPVPTSPVPSGPAPSAVPWAGTRVGGRRWRLAAAAGAALLAVGCVAFVGVTHRTRQGGRFESQRLVSEGRKVFFGAGDQQSAFPKARALFLRAHDADPSNPDADAWASFTFTNMITAGYTADPAADLSEAARLADRAVALGPGLGLSWAARAAVYKLQRRYADALLTYRRSVELDPTQLPAEANTGWMLILLGQPQQAMVPIRSVLAATRPDHPFRATWLCYLGMAQFAAGAADYGVDAFRGTRGKADGCVPAADLAFTLVAALALDGQNSEARPLLETTRRQWPSVTTQTLRNDAISTDPGYLAQREKLFQGLALAGFSDGSPAP